MSAHELAEVGVAVGEQHGRAGTRVDEVLVGDRVGVFAELVFDARGALRMS